MSYKFSNTSLDRLATCHEDLQLIAKEAIKVSQVDFGIACGHRTKEDQLKAFRGGFSKIDGITRKGKHNYSPSLAFDVYAWIGKASWDVAHLTYIGGVITSTALRLKNEGKISSSVRWGANWDGDGVIITDQSFDDLPHFEI